MFDTIFDGNEIQDYKKGMSESIGSLECAQSAAALMIAVPWISALQGRVATWGSSPRSLGLVQTTGTEPVSLRGTF